MQDSSAGRGRGQGKGKTPWLAISKPNTGRPSIISNSPNSPSNSLGNIPDREESSHQCQNNSPKSLSGNIPDREESSHQLQTNTTSTYKEILEVEEIFSNFEKNTMLNPFQLPCRNIVSHVGRKKNSPLGSNTPLTISQRLIFFLKDREQLAQDIVENLPSEIYYKIVQTPSTAETQLISKINQLVHTFPEESYRVIKLKISSLRLLLNPSTPQSQKI